MRSLATNQTGKPRFKTQFSPPEEFVVYPQPVDFGPKDQREFYDYVVDMNDNTTMVPIMEPSDIELDDDGRVTCGRTKYRLSIEAFNEVGKVQAAGLSTLAADIAGVKRRENRIDAVVSTRTAARIINGVTELRFRMKEGIFSRQLIVNRTTGVIDGIVGPKYR